MNNIPQKSLRLLRPQRGLTLIEILVALVISLFLTAGVIQLFIGTKQTYRFHDALSRIQENARFALDSMTMDIRMAGYSPLGTPPLANAVATNGTDANGNDDIAVSWLNNGAQTRNYAIGPRTVAAGATAPTCPTAGTSLRLNRNGGGLQEFIEGVEAMQILYGICTNGIVNPPYVNAAAVTAVGAWNNVCSVRIHLLLVSLDNNVVTQPQTVFFPADTNNIWPVAANDRCLRQAFSTTVRIRNR